MAVSSPSIKQSYRTMANNLKTSFDQFNLRDCLLSSCQELNRGEFFVLLQMSLLVFFPSLGLSIICQTCDVNEADADQQLDINADAEIADDQDLLDYTRIRTMEQQQTQKKSTQKISTRTNAHGSEDSEEAMRGIENGEGRGYGAVRVTTKVWQTVVIHF